MLALARGGMTITGVLDPGQAARAGRRRRRLSIRNIELFYQPTKASRTLRKVHHKLMVIDERIVVAGSFNYTEPANEYNDENIFVLGSVARGRHGVAVVEPTPSRRSPAT